MRGEQPEARRHRRVAQCEASVRDGVAVRQRVPSVRTGLRFKDRAAQRPQFGARLVLRGDLGHLVAHEPVGGGGERLGDVLLKRTHGGRLRLAAASPLGGPVGAGGHVLPRPLALVQLVEAQASRDGSPLCPAIGTN